MEFCKISKISTKNIGLSLKYRYNIGIPAKIVKYRKISKIPTKKFEILSSNKLEMRFLSVLSLLECREKISISIFLHALPMIPNLHQQNIFSSTNLIVKMQKTCMSDVTPPAALVQAVRLAKPRWPQCHGRRPVRGCPGSSPSHKS